MNAYEKQISEAIASHELSKKAIQNCLNFMKSGKAKRYLGPIADMACEFPLSDEEVKLNETRSEWNKIVPKPAVAVSFSPFYGAIHVYVNVYQLTGFTDQRLTGVLETLEYLNPGTTDMHEDAASLTKTINYTYSVKNGDNTTPIYVSVTAHVKGDSPTCKRVAVGVEESAPRIKYKIVCEDGADAVPTNIVPEEGRMSDDELGNEFP